MTIRRGEQWGEAVVPPADLVLASTDADLAGIVRAARSTGTPVPSIGLTGGDLARTMGGGDPDRFRGGGTVVRATVDLLRIEADGRSTLAAAHLVCRRHWWRGAVTFVMNAQFLGRLDVAPRSHPNDGRADVLDIDPAMDLRTRLQAYRRALTGTHVPHPQFTERRISSVDLRFDRPTDLWVDGERWITARQCTVTVESDAVVVHA